ncbi:hypothetical protein C457_14284 [Haloferax prahovense DSM 18310]|uniref:Uncharacterized protein n=1 Tax=Haloferax prahovense (strain DSM 18310 / JCM 13924 / TL6) TaxID=1227461 RepID=M0G4T9_HALPT|nr:hypothetical protein C457_14284 [Haloferax prahovense DSM 18310]
MLSRSELDVVPPQLSGSITLICSREADDPLAGLDDADGAFDANERDHIAEQIADESVAPRPASEVSGDVSSFDLGYGDREIVADRAIPSEASIAVTSVPFNGGRIDSSSFWVREAAGADELTFHIIVAPPGLNSAERDALDRLPAGEDVPDFDPESDLSTAAAAVVAVTIAAVAVSSSGRANHAFEAPSGASSDADSGQSVSELIEARVGA